MKYIPQSEADQKQLLESLGLKKIDDLFSYIPDNLRISKPLDYPRAQSEMEIRSTFRKISSLAQSPTRSFAGCGIYSHDIPSVVPFIQSRSEFSTAYTPYQPEISQGLLQAIFEYQTLVCQLTECELSNASVYDGATALAEGALLGLRVKKKSDGKILVSSSLHPFYEQVLHTYLTEFEDRIVKVPNRGDSMDLAELEKLSRSASDILITQSPNIFGVVEDYAAIGKIVNSSQLFWVSSTMEPLSFGVLRGPGAFGAHVVTAEGQSFGNSPYLGGSSFGIFATKDEYLRQLPGRLVGETVDEKGRRSYTLTFATREQFIRRDKATSNICTNHNLNMLGGLIYLSALGKRGIRELAIQNLSLAEYAKSKIRSETDCKISESPTFSEFVVETRRPAKEVSEKSAEENWIAGVDLGRFSPDWKNKLLVNFTEQHQREDIDELVNLLRRWG